MTPGAGTARHVRGIALGGVRGGAGKLRYCGGHPGDTSVAPTLRGVRPRNRGCHPGDTSVAPTARDVRPRNCGRPTGRARWCRRWCGATTRDDARRGAIYDARCRNGTTRPWHCVGRCTRWCRQIVILRRTDRATQVSPLRCGVFVHDIAADRRGGPVVPAALRRDDARRRT